MNSYVLVESDEALEQWLDELRNVPVLAIDAERASGFRYGQSAYLLQILADNIAILVDPTSLSVETTKELSKVLNQSEWILHSATQDLPCLNELGLYPAKIFDTEVAAKLLGFEKIGLAALVQRYVDIELKKEHSASDWSQRPLTEEMLEYAAQDVYYLHEIREKLIEELAAANKTDYAAQEFEFLLSFKPKPPSANPWRKTSGLHSLTKPIQLARLRDMWTVRDTYAQAHDIAPGRIVSDRSLSHAAVSEYTSLVQMKKDKQFHGRLIGKLYNKLYTAYSEAANSEHPPLREASELAIPHHKNWQKLKPSADKRYKKLKVLLAELAEEVQIPVEVIISPSVVREAIWNEVAPDRLADFFQEKGVRPWQSGLVLPLFGTLD